MLWAVAALAGMLAWGNLGGRLSSSVEAPESDSHTVSEIVRRDFGEAAESSFLVLYEAPASRWRSPAFVAAVRASVRRAARAAAGRSSPLSSISARLTYATLPTALSAATAAERTAAIEAAAGRVHGARVEVTGFPIIAEELSAIITHDLHRAEMVAIPVTAVILLLLFGSLPAVAVPLLFALTTISVAMGIVWVEAAFVEIPVYAQSVVTLVGIALAVDYSMLYVSRYREEARAGPRGTRPLRETARTAGRALAISGLVVAAGLLPMALIPIPFFGGLGLATFGIPLISVLAAATLLPALLEMLGPRLERLPVRVPRRLRLGAGERPPSRRLAAAVIRRPLPSALAAATVMVLVALPALDLSVTGGSGEFLQLAHLPAASGGVGQGAVLAPSEVLVDSGRDGGAWAAPTLVAERRLVARLATDPAVAAVQAPTELAPGRLSSAAVRRRAERLGLVDRSGRFLRIRISGSEESGSRPADALIERLRHVYVPAAGFGAMPAEVGGAAAQDYDFVRAIATGIPPFGLVLVLVMFCLLTAMLGSVVLPLKAIAMSALSVAAACGVLVLVFQLGWGAAVGLDPADRVVVWVPVLLFAAMFGISTDYEIFMVTRMREEWLASGDNRRAVRVGLRRISGVVTASALVMIVIFAGFTTSRVVALQQFGVGLVAGVFLDATVIRLVLVPSLMILLGRWNWTFAGPIPTAGRPLPDAEAGPRPLTRADEGE